MADLAGTFPRNGTWEKLEIAANRSVRCMSGLMTVNAIVVTLNLVLLSGLLVLYGRMLKSVPTRFTAGLVLFAGVLWLQNAVQLYFFATMMAYYAGTVEGLVLIQNALGTLASLFLAYVTFRPEGRPRRASHTT